MVSSIGSSWSHFTWRSVLLLIRSVFGLKLCHALLRPPVSCWLSAVDLTGTSWKHFQVSRRTSGTQSTNNCSSSRFSWSPISNAESRKNRKYNCNYLSDIATLELQLGFKINLWLPVIDPEFDLSEPRRIDGVLSVITTEIVWKRDLQILSQN